MTLLTSGILSSLLLGSVGSKFDRFLKNIELTTLQKLDLLTKQESVRKSLHTAWYPTPYTGSTSRLVGSHGKGTAVRPPSDIDIQFIVPPAQWSRYSQLSGNKQSQLLQDTKQILQKTFSNTDMRTDGQVVVVPFTSFKVEVAPGFTLTNHNFFICDTNNGGSWKEVAPQGELSHLNLSDIRSKGSTRNLVRMLKDWRRECGVPIKALALELLAIEFLSAWQYFDKGSVYYDWMIRDFFAFMISKAWASVALPVTGEVIRLGDAWKSRAESAYARAAKACGHESASASQQATEEWKKIFGDLFQG